MSEKQERIAIIGAGLAGSLMACYLGREGYHVTVYERRSDPRIAGFVGGRSINLALSERGLKALREVGLAEEVLQKAIPMPGRMIHDVGGGLHFQAYSKNPDDSIKSVSRGELNLILINAAAKNPNVRFIFDHRCTNIDFNRAGGPAITFLDTKSNQLVRAETDLIIGADGAFSAVRLQMMLNMDRFDYRQDYLQHGYKELTIPPVKNPKAKGPKSKDMENASPNLDFGNLDFALSPNAPVESPKAKRPKSKESGTDDADLDFGNMDFALPPNALHIWPRGGYMMIALPNTDRSFTCTCFWPFSGPNGFDALQTDEQILNYFKQHFPDAVPLMPTLVEDYKRNPTSSLVTIHCWPWHYAGKAVILGDAAHAIVPFYGQGMNCAFEDCSELMNCLRRFAPDWQQAFETFANIRKPNADAIADMALDNFIEMRDKTASPLFRAKKRMQHILHGWFPQQFTPLYNMISFSTIPYAEARRRAKAQSRTLKLIAGAAAGLILLLIIMMIWRVF